MRCFVEIKNADGQYSGAIHQGNPALARSLPDLKLGPDDEVAIQDRAYRLDALVQTLIAHQPQDLKIAYQERGQLEIGHYLYRQIFGDHPPSEFQREGDERVDLRIVTGDEHVARLPWVLLAHQGLFLSAAGWSVSLARTCRVRDCTLPPEPKILVVAPEPEGVTHTKAQSHLETLEYRLSLYDHHLSLGDHLQVATTWEGFRQLLGEFQPHIVYYYGHGVGDRYRSRLVFATGEGRRVDKPVADFAQCLRELEEPPRLVYVNCCSGDAGGFLGAGWQLGEFIPAVVTNRTVAYVDAAQAQALALWQSILLDGQPPHVAMTQIRGKLVDLDLTFSDVRWLTPVIHCHYAGWKSTPPQRIAPSEHDPHWHLKLDRVVQFGTVAFQARQMLRERRPRTLAYVWYGQEGQGVDLFHKRLKVELQDDLATHAHFVQVRPEWPMDLHDPDRSFADMMSEAFDVHSLQDVPRVIRAHSRGATGRQTLVYVRHQPVRSKKVLDPGTFKAYLQWWDKRFASLLQDRYYALLTVSFEVDNPAKFRKAMLEGARLYDIELSRTVFRLLDELEQVGMRDLFEFLQTHNIRLPRAHKDRILQEILEQTNGHYEQTISALKRLVNRALDAPEEKVAAPEQTEEFDY
jgi:hypothetical protein